MNMVVAMSVICHALCAYERMGGKGIGGWGQKNRKWKRERRGLTKRGKEMEKAAKQGKTCLIQKTCFSRMVS